MGVWHIGGATGFYPVSDGFDSHSPLHINTLAIRLKVNHLSDTQKPEERYLDRQPYAPKALWPMHRFCKPESRVQFSMGAPETLAICRLK